MSDDGPPLLRPIPRRPFGLNLTSPTPPEEDSQPTTPNPDQAAFLLNPHSDDSLPRTQSVLNLTASTLFGIFAPSTPSTPSLTSPSRFERMGSMVDRLGLDDAEIEASTPWGTGAQTPVKRRHDLDDGTFELMRDRSHVPMLRRRDSTRVPTKPTRKANSRDDVALGLALALRVGLLFLLGMGYGAMVTRLRAERHVFGDAMGQVVKTATAEAATGWTYLVVWGVSGVALGALLPWFDGVWQSAFGEVKNPSEDVRKGDAREQTRELGTNPNGTDWSVVVRSIGAFMGIVFAIRKLTWASTLQVSLTLALVNPFLWYLIDRSKPGFLLSAAVGLTGSAILLGINPNVMPSPMQARAVSASSFSSLYQRNSSSTFEAPSSARMASQEALESGIWMVSVLFCSCVCFGNIGRRLALHREAGREGLTAR